MVLAVRPGPSGEPTALAIPLAASTLDTRLGKAKPGFRGYCRRSCSGDEFLVDHLGIGQVGHARLRIDYAYQQIARLASPRRAQQLALGHSAVTY
jgi:hypothetical protein